MKAVQCGFFVIALTVFFDGAPGIFAADVNQADQGKPGAESAILQNGSHHKDKAVAEGRVYVHPVTGDLVSTPITPEQQRAVPKVAKMLRGDKTGLPMQVFPSGAIRIELDESFRENMQMRKAAKGKWEKQCGALTDHAHGSANR